MCIYIYKYTYSYSSYIMGFLNQLITAVHQPVSIKGNYETLGLWGYIYVYILWHVYSLRTDPGFRIPLSMPSVDTCS